MIICEPAGIPTALAVFNLGHITNEFATGLICQMFEASLAGDALLVLGQFLLWSTAGATRRLRVAAKGTTLEELGEEIALVTLSALPICCSFMSGSAVLATIDSLQIAHIGSAFLLLQLVALVTFQALVMIRPVL